MTFSDITVEQLKTARDAIYQHLVPTPQLSWPLLNERCGCEVWVKHENHLPTGAFKVRGGLWYTENLRKERPEVHTVIAATRGNHGQSVACAAALHGLHAVIVVPHGNSPDKNRAMTAYGAELIEHGRDFNEAFDHTKALAEENQYHMFPTLHPRLVQGVGTGSLELLTSVADLHTVYVPIGMGSGICGMIAARNALGLDTQIVGVVAANAPTFALSFAEKKPVPTETADTLADGLAVRIPDPLSLEYMITNVDRVLTVSEEALLRAIRYYFTDTHNLAEGAGASTLAALLQEKASMQDKKVGVVLSGGNIDADLYMRALAFR